MKRAFIYCDEGCSLIGVMSLLIGVHQHLGLTAQVISAEQILAGELANAAMLIVPGGRDLPYCAKLNGRGNQLIREFVRHGGFYVGICAGAYYGCSALDFRGKDYSVIGSRELAFFDGVARGCLPHLTDGNAYDETLVSKAMIEVNLENGEAMTAYYHGGCAFLPNQGAEFDAIACYPDDTLAVVSGKFGKGNYVLSGIHFELQQGVYRQNVVDCCQDLQEKQRELQICRYFDQKYGIPIWQVIQKRLK